MLDKSYSLDNIRSCLNEPYYRGIIYLLLFYSYGRGLQQKHFRFALMKEPDLKFTDSIEKTFEKPIPLDRFYKIAFATKGVVNTQKDLNYYLRFLCKKQIIKINHEDQKPYYYQLTDFFQNESNKMRILDNIKSWTKDTNFNRDFFYYKYAPDKKIKWIPIEGTPVASYKPSKHGGFLVYTIFDDFDWTLAGVSIDREKWDHNDIDTISSCLQNIEKNLWKIHEINNKWNKEMDIGFFFHCNHIFKE